MTEQVLDLESMEEVEIDHVVEDDLDAFDEVTKEDAYSQLFLPEISKEEPIKPRSADELETLGLKGPMKYLSSKEYFERMTRRAIEAKLHFEGTPLKVDTESSKNYLSPEPTVSVLIVTIRDTITIPIFVTDAMKPTGYLNMSAINEFAKDLESIDDSWENFSRPVLVVDGDLQPVDRK